MKLVITQIERHCREQLKRVAKNKGIKLYALLTNVVNEWLEKNKEVK